MVCISSLCVLGRTNAAEIVLAVDPALVKYSSMFFLHPGGLAADYDGDDGVAGMG